MAMRIKRTIEIMLSNYNNIMGACVFSYEGKIAYTTDNMNITQDINQIIHTWKSIGQSLYVHNIPFIVALTTAEGLVAINPDGAVAFVLGTGKGVWFVSIMAPMDADKHSLLKECIQAAKNLETSVSIFDI
jgi:hypothetical protein